MHLYSGEHGRFALMHMYSGEHGRFALIHKWCMGDALVQW